MFPQIANQNQIDFPNFKVPSPSNIDYETWPTRMSMDNDARYVISSGFGTSNKYIHNGLTGDLLHTFTGDTGGPVVISPDGRYAFYSNYTLTVGPYSNVGRVFVANTSNGSAFRVYNSPDVTANNYFGNSITISPNGKRIAVGGDQYRLPDGSGGTNPWGKIFIYDFETNTLINSLTHPLYTPTATYPGNLFFGSYCSFNYDGTKILISCSFETVSGSLFAGRAYLYDVNTGTLLRTFSPADPANTQLFGSNVTLNSDGTKAIIPEDFDDGTNFGRRYNCFDTSSGLVLWTFNPRYTITNGIQAKGIPSLSSDNTYFYSGIQKLSNQSTAAQIDANTGTLIREYYTNATNSGNFGFGSVMLSSRDNARIVIGNSYQSLAGDPRSEQGVIHLFTRNNLFP